MRVINKFLKFNIINGNFNDDIDWLIAWYVPELSLINLSCCCVCRGVYIRHLLK